MFDLFPEGVPSSSTHLQNLPESQAQNVTLFSNDLCIKATRNSGRTNKDGDHLLAESIVLDTKLQSQRINPQVNLAELDKVRFQAVSHNKAFGALVLRNKHDVGVVVMAEADFAKLVNQR